ncbi:MAG: hypothetical protein EP343_16260 [Deltaproteobacteria bacterium]|nr:MAG: hypothetical protein EP343_16260 [Deltaproteobacteria bacterium]
MKLIPPHQDSTSQDMEMIGNALSHDLQAPIRAISNFAQHLAQNESEKMSPKGQLYCEFIVEANDQMQRFVKGLLSYIRLTQQPPRLMPLPLSDLLNEIASELTNEIQQSQAVLEIPDNLPTLHCDLRLLRHSLKPLLSNALLYVPPERKPHITITAEEQEQSLTLKISDNGVGIPEEFVEAIFQPLKRLHNQDEYPGVGLGLNIANRAITLLGGQLALDSTPDQGSTFCLTFPHETHP